MTYQLWEVVRAEDREAVVNADRRDGRRNDGGVATQKTKTANLNRQRKTRRRSQAQNERNDSQNQSQTTLISYILT